MSGTRTRSWVWVLAALTAIAVGPAPGDPPGPAGRHALLVGVTVYPAFKGRLDLQGPANDVLLMEELLRVHYGFPAANITILSEAAGQANGRRLPSRANIRRECERLASEARDGYQVVVFLVGHGSLQPEHPDDPEPDGLDKMFLPRDVGRGDGADRVIPNAVSGREIGNWLRPIPGKNALLWVVVDACYSGEMIRGPGERARLVPPTDLGILQADLDRARTGAARRQQGGRGDGPRVSPVRLGREPGVVILYACQSGEVTVESPLPQAAPDQKLYGLFTFTLNKVLRSAPTKLTYQDVILGVQREYDAAGRWGPTPLAEGRARADLVLAGVKADRPAAVVERRGGKLVITAGRLHGQNPGNILAVTGIDGADLGHVRVMAEVGPTTARVEPHPHAGRPVGPAEGLVGGHCRLVWADFGELKPRVGVDAHDFAGRPISEADRRRLHEALGRLAKKPVSVVEAVGKPEDAQWFVRQDAGELYLLRASARDGDRGPRPAAAARPLKLDRVERGRAPDAALEESLGRIVRAQQLVRIASEVGPPRGDEGDTAVRVAVRRQGVGEQESRLAEGPVRTLYHKDRVEYEITNLSRYAVDVTLLYVDSRFGIEVLYPVEGDVNRIKPGDRPRKVPPDPDKPIVQDECTSGREWLVVIAVRAAGQPVDFSSFRQPTLGAASDRAAGRGGQKRGFDSALGQLLRRTMYGDGEARAGLSFDELKTYGVQLIPLQVEAPRAPGDRPDR